MHKNDTSQMKIFLVLINLLLFICIVDSLISNILYLIGISENIRTIYIWYGDVLR